MKWPTVIQPLDLILGANIFMVHGSFYRLVKAVMSQVVSRECLDWCQPTLKLVHALGTRLKVLPPVFYACLYWCVVAQLEM